ncbi:MAG: MerR family transcriptional regulator [Gemmataceae bacterium]|nr:MerR family transcriptional regulator [Gemmataceae bacterium]
MTLMQRGRYSLAEVAAAVGCSPRTIRYYITQGALPGAVHYGPGPNYTDEHIRRARLIRQAQLHKRIPLAMRLGADVAPQLDR